MPPLTSSLTREDSVFFQIRKAHHYLCLSGTQSHSIRQSGLQAPKASVVVYGALSWYTATRFVSEYWDPPRRKTINKILALGNKTCLLGTPDTSRSGRNTRKARRALTSKPPDLPLEWLPPSVSLVNCSKITLNNLKEEERKKC